MLFKAGARLPFDFLYFCLVLGSQRKRSATYREEHLGSEEFLLVKPILRMEICPKQQLCSRNSLVGEYIARSRSSPTQILICLLFSLFAKKSSWQHYFFEDHFPSSFLRLLTLTEHVCVKHCAKHIYMCNFILSS